MTQEYSLAFGKFKIHFPGRTLCRDGAELRLGSRALEILVALVEAPGELVSNQALTARVWPNTVVDEGSLRVHMSALRKALGDGRDGVRLIVNEMGRGYRLAAVVEREEKANVVDEAVEQSRQASLTGLPGLVTGIVGRTEVVDGLCALLSERRLMTISGSGGIGKTTVALAIAHGFQAKTSCRATFVDFAPLTVPSRAGTAIAIALGVAVSSEDPLPDLVAAIGSEPILLVLDNCEHLIDSVAALAERMLRGSTNLRLLVTSREPLRAEGEWVHRLGPLETPRDLASVGVEQALSYPAIALFVERARAANDTFHMTAENVAAVCDICRQLDGIPLAIEMASARVASMDVRTLATRLVDRFALLTRGRRTALPRQQTLRAMLDWSYALLEPDVQTVLQRLSLFRTEFDIDAAAAVAACNDIDDMRVFDAAADLVAKSLLVSDTDGATTTYRLLETTRHYLLDKLAETDSSDVRRRHALYCCSLFTDPGPAWDGGAQRELTVVHSAAIDDLRAAFDWAASSDGDPTIAVRLATTSSPLWFQLSLPYEFMKLAERAIEAVSRANLNGSIHHVEMLNAYGHAIWHTRGPVQEMADAFRTSLEVARTLNDVDVEMRCMWGMWSQKLQSGQYADSLKVTQAYQLLAGGSSQLATSQTAKHTHALSQERLGNLDVALRIIEEVLVVDCAHPVRAGHANAAQMDGRTAAWTLKMRILWVQGFCDSALSLAREAVAECAAIGHNLSTCFCLGMGVLPVALWCGDFAFAQEVLSMLRNTTKKKGLLFWDSWADGFEAILLGTRFDARASTVYQMEIFASNGDESSIALLCDQGRDGEITWCRPELIRRKAIRAGVPDEDAERQIRYSLALAEQQGALSWGLRSAMSLAQLLARRGDSALAWNVLSDVRKSFPEGHSSADAREADELLLFLSPK
jgi:predicted ATPase/DNA-binding winged helix-turn-helix (wHTH) protein